MRIYIKSEQIKHLSHPTPYPSTIQAFNLRSREVGSDMRKHPFLHKQVIPAQQYLSHHITFIPKMFEAVLRPKVIKTISPGKTLRTTAVHRVAIIVYRLITTLEKLKANVPTSLHHIPLRFRYEVIEQAHNTRFATAHGSSLTIFNRTYLSKKAKFNPEAAFSKRLPIINSGYKTSMWPQGEEDGC